MTPDTNSTELHLLIVDDHKMIRDGLKLMLGTLKKHYTFRIDEAESGEQALKKIAKREYDLLIIDYQMPGMSGAETVTRILRFRSGAKILALSNYDELVYIKAMLEAGAGGYVLKHIDAPQLLTAIRTLLNGKPYYASEVAVKLLDDVTSAKKETGGSHDLTRREIEVLKLIALELTNEEIAEQLFIGKRTVDTHRQNLLLKLGAKNTVGLIKAAYKLSLI